MVCKSCIGIRQRFADGEHRCEWLLPSYSGSIFRTFTEREAARKEPRLGKVRQAQRRHSRPGICCQDKSFARDNTGPGACDYLFGCR